jgi:hypothetical protein
MGFRDRLLCLIGAIAGRFLLTDLGFELGPPASGVRGCLFGCHQRFAPSPEQSICLAPLIAGRTYGSLVFR